MNKIKKWTIFRILFIYAAILLNPPWINGRTQEFLGFYFIAADDFEAHQFATIDTARLFVTIGLVSLLIAAIHLALSSSTFKKIFEFISNPSQPTDAERRKKDKTQDMYFRLIGIAGVVTSIAFIIYASTRNG